MSREWRNFCRNGGNFWFNNVLQIEKDEIKKGLGMPLLNVDTCLSSLFSSLFEFFFDLLQFLLVEWIKIHE